MSLEAFAWAARQKLPSTQKLVLLMLADRHNGDTGQCRPSHDKLADDCGLSRRSVIDQIGRLAEAGYIVVLPRAKDNLRLPNQYRLNFHFGIQPKPTDAEADPYLVVNDVHHPVVNDVHHPVNQVHPGSAGAAQEPVIQPGREPKKKKQRASAPAVPAVALDFSSWPSEPSPQVLSDWLHLRRRRRADVTPTVLTSFGQQLHAASLMGFTVDECLTKCCARNWTGFEAAWLDRDIPANNRNTGPTHGNHRESAADRVRRHAAEGDFADAERLRLETGAVIEGHAHAVVDHGRRLRQSLDQ